MMLRERKEESFLIHFWLTVLCMFKYVHALILFFVVAMLGRYLSNHGSQHWKAAKKVLRYLQGTKDLMLTYQRINILDVVGFCDANFVGCIDDKNPL